MRKTLTFAIVVTVITFAISPLTAAAQTSLKDAFKNSFLIGAAINRAQIFGEDARGVKLLEAQFNSITPENVLKWALVHPQPGVYDFAAADRYVEFGEKHGMVVIGHTLVWHNQVPKWVFEDAKGNPVSREVLLQRMREHIQTVVGRYKGRIHGWDVVNEALNEDGTMRESPWMKIIGPDYVEQAFKFAHQADPQAQLYYNDYSLENEAKRKGAVALIKKLQAAAIPVAAVGLQDHDNLTFPSAQQEDATIAAFEQLGIHVNITELDITVLPSATKEPTADVQASAENSPALNPFTAGLPDSVQQALAKRYGDLFAVFMKHRKSIDRVTFWGVTDAESWKNNWPARGRTDYPLLFDRNGAPKPAFNAVLRTAEAH
jgi:endo-1,4-beta-xylanase